MLTPERFEHLQGWARDLVQDGHSEGGAMRELIQEVKRLRRQLQKKTSEPGVSSLASGLSQPRAR